MLRLPPGFTRTDPFLPDASLFRYERNTRAPDKRAQDVLRPLLARAGDDPLFQATFARINAIAGDPIRAGEEWAEAAYLNGRPERALVQITNLKKRSHLDYYTRARIASRLAPVPPVVLTLRRPGARDPELHSHSYLP